MNFKQAKLIAKEHGMTIKRIVDCGEYMVNWIGAPESIAYFTDSIDDAVETLKVMAKEGRAKR